MKGKITIVIPDIPPSLNKWSRMHWTKTAEIKKRWEANIYYTSFSQRPKLPYKYAKVIITYYFKTRQRHDLDNYVPKFILDGLVKARIILDDRAEYIGMTELIQEYDKENQRTKIKIEEVEE